MRVRLMDPDRDFDTGRPADVHDEELLADLGIESLVAVMAEGDPAVADIARAAILDPVEEPATIAYRHGVLGDCIRHPGLVAELRALAADAAEAKRVAGWALLGRNPSSILYGARQAMATLLGHLHALRRFGEEHASAFASDGFGRFFESVAADLDDPYLDAIADALDRLDFPRGAVLGASLGVGNKGDSYVLIRPEGKASIRERLGAAMQRRPPGFQLDPRDEAGSKDLADLRSRGTAPVAKAAASVVGHVVAYFKQLRTELDFYLGAARLRDQLDALGVATCLPEIDADSWFEATDLVDAGLAVRSGERPIGNDVDQSGPQPIVITGANQGGKSTLLRAIGLAQLTAQAGMFVAAAELRCSPRTRVFTHFKRGEDADLQHGKFEEELARMSSIADAIQPGAMVLFNESFAATNEAEGSQLAAGIVSALLDRDVSVAFVTHMYELTRLLGRASPPPLYLRAERSSDGSRSFRLVEAEPLRTSFGMDIYERALELAAGGRGGGE